jgi:hypothetical protein
VHVFKADSTAAIRTASVPGGGGGAPLHLLLFLTLTRVWEGVGSADAPQARPRIRLGLER